MTHSLEPNLVLASKPSPTFSGLRSDATRRSRALTHWRNGIVTTFANWTIAVKSINSTNKKGGIKNPAFLSTSPGLLLDSIVDSDSASLHSAEMHHSAETHHAAPLVGRAPQRHLAQK